MEKAAYLHLLKSLNWFEMKMLLWLWFFIGWVSLVSGQSVFSGGPITGGVTDESARVYFRTTGPIELVLEYGTDGAFSGFDTLHAFTNPNRQYAITLDLTGLTPDSRYFYRLRDRVADTLVSDVFRFRTFPPQGQVADVRLVVGSCNYNNMPGGGHGNPDFMNDLMFQAMVDFDPHLFIHLGDWGYPPGALGSAHLAVPGLAAQSFDIRYNDPNMKQYILPNMAVDFVYDDDYSHNNTAGWTYPVIRTDTIAGGQTKYILEDLMHPPGLRDSAITAYYRHFPAYPQVDTSGIHHKITIGTVDILMTDTRSSKTPIHAPFVYHPATNDYTFEPDPSHTTLGPTQRAWLVNELANSQADWKTLGTSVLFNQKMGVLMDILIAGQLFSRSVIEYASSLAYMWPAYAVDLDAVLSTVANDSIRDVVVISGDTHSSMMDDGANAGLPELSSSGLSAADEGYLNYTIDSLFQEFSLTWTVKNNLWNGGGSGIENANFSDTWATMEFFGKDSLRMCIIDEFLQTLACLTLPHSSKATTGIGIKQNSRQTDFFHLLYPNPAKDKLQVRFDPLLQAGVCKILNLDGKSVLPEKQLQPGETTATFYIANLPQGTYLFVFESPQHRSARKFVKR